MQVRCTFQKIDLSLWKGFILSLTIAGSFSISSCTTSDQGSKLIGLTATQLQAANTWTSRASREIDLALRDTFTQTSPDSLLYASWLDSLRIADVVVKSAQDRIGTDLIVLERLLAGKKSSEVPEIIKEYWTNDDRLGKLEDLCKDAFQYLHPQANDSTNTYTASTDEYWNGLLSYEDISFQTACLQGASLELNIAYLDFLEQYRQHVGLPPYPTHALRLLIAPESKSLLAGEQFQARVWMGSATEIPALRFEGVGVSTDSAWADEALVRIPAGADSIYQERSWKQTFSVEASFFNEGGQQQQYYIRDSFSVSRPAVRWYGQQPMYIDCEHRVQIEAPLLGNALNPSFNVQGGNITAATDSAIFSLVPESKALHVAVFQAAPQRSVLLDTFYYECVQTPRPRIVLLVNGQPYSGLTSIPKRSRLVLQVLADPEFEQYFPADAQYGMEAAEVLIQQKPDDPPRSILKFNGRGRSGSQGVPILLDETPVPLPPGTLLHFRAENIFRRNFKGEFLPEERFSERERAVSVVIR